jgi:hypothetical protein
VEEVVVEEVMGIIQLPVNLAGRAVVLMAAGAQADVLRNPHNHKQLGQLEVLLITETPAEVGPVVAVVVLVMPLHVPVAHREDLVVLPELVQVTLEVEILLKEFLLMDADVVERPLNRATLE